MLICALMFLATISIGQGLHTLQGLTNNASQTGGMLWVGDNTSTYLSFDNNEIQARNAANPSTLFANYWGGSIDLLGVFNSTGNLNVDITGMVYVNSTDRLGLGTGAPADKLHVMGDLRLDATGTRKFGFYNGATQSSYIRQFSSGLVQWVNLTTQDTELWTNNGNTLALELTNQGVARSPYGRYGGNGDGLAWVLGVNGQSIFRGPESNGTTSGGINIISGSQSMWLDGNEIDAEVDQLAFNFNTNGDVVIRNNETRTDLSIGHSTGSPALGDGVTFENQGANNEFWSIYVENSTGDLELWHDNTYRGQFNPTTGAYSSVSDKRLKKDIVDMESILDKVMQAKPKRYKFKSDETNQECIGFIAQEMELLFPEVVSKGTEGDSGQERYTMDYGLLSTIAIQAVKEQQVIINNLKTQIEQIKKQLESITKD